MEISLKTGIEHRFNLSELKYIVKLYVLLGKLGNLTFPYGILKYCLDDTIGGPKACSKIRTPAEAYCLHILYKLHVIYIIYVNNTLLPACVFYCRLLGYL